MNSIQQKNDQESSSLPTFDAIEAVGKSKRDEYNMQGMGTTVAEWQRNSETAGTRVPEKESTQTSNHEPEDNSTISDHEDDPDGPETFARKGLAKIQVSYVPIAQRDMSHERLVDRPPGLESHSLKAFTQARDKFIESVQGSANAVEELCRDRTKEYPIGGGPPFRHIKTLGRGSSAKIDSVISSISYREFARKRPLAADTRRHYMMQIFREEVAILRRVQHHHCTELVHSYMNQGVIAILTLPVAEYDLQTFYDSVPGFRSRAVLLYSFFGCLANALRYLHGIQIRHRNIKPSNILVKGHSVYLAGFGSAMDWKEMEDDSDDTPASFTRRYAAPEILEYRKNDSSSDIWSLGCVFVEMAIVLSNEGADSIGDGMKTSWRAHPKALAADLATKGSGDVSPVVPWVKSMFSADPASRPTASVLFKDIVETNNQGRVRFCGTCCMGDKDPAIIDNNVAVL